MFDRNTRAIYNFKSVDDLQYVQDVEVVWEESVLGDKQEGRMSYLLLGWMTGGILLCASLVIWGGSTLTTVNAVQSMRRGEAQQYSQEYEERWILLEENSIREYI